ncbi:PR domain zinc finger protein 8 isoform X2 [Erpetoichthys calabaricus]|nr:PR domain zinc finger protein 8 isoform X2 [Erpetoichthys calabaricus]
MDLNYFSKSIWANDSKLPHHHLTDLLTSVYITRDVPEGTTFGPCLLQNTFYDTIAFIALKCSDRRNKSYVFRVDTEAMQNSPNVLHWLRLVQAASNSKEQNLEAFLKGGQLYFRSTRNIKKDEELLVWYDDELSHLLGFSEIKARLSPDGFKCLKCDQTFKNENPFMAHTRFLCIQGKNDFQERKMTEIKRTSRVTDFHNIARDLEFKRGNAKEDIANVFFRKGKCIDQESVKSNKSVLLEKTNFSNVHNTVFMNRDSQDVVPELTASVLKLSDGKYLLTESKSSAFTEVRKDKDRIKNEKTETISEKHNKQTGLNRLVADSALKSTGSAFSLVVPKGAEEDQKSAFCKPSKRVVSDCSALPPHKLNVSTGSLRDLSDSITSNDILGYGSLLGSKLLNTDLATTTSLQTNIHMTSSLPYASEAWPRQIGVQLQTTSSLTLLPPSFTSFGVAAQNWCAKCNLAFRMTSDLVFHMRSHHKKEFAVESQTKRRREEKLTCPICHEYFRERHHLSRHMTSHN